MKRICWLATGGTIASRPSENGLVPGFTWQYSTDGGKTWIAGTGSSFVLQQGTYAANSVLVKQTDVAGNVGANSAITSVPASMECSYYRRPG